MSEKIRVNVKVNDPIVAYLVQTMAHRDARGYAKYGLTTHDNPLPLREWLEHALEETLDKAVYLRRSIEEIDRLPAALAVEAGLIRPPGEKPCPSSPTSASPTGTRSAETDSTDSKTPSTDG